MITYKRCRLCGHYLDTSGITRPTAVEVCSDCVKANYLRTERVYRLSRMDYVALILLALGAVGVTILILALATVAVSVLA